MWTPEMRNSLTNFIKGKYILYYNEHNEMYNEFALWMTVKWFLLVAYFMRVYLYNIVLYTRRFWWL